MQNESSSEYAIVFFDGVCNLCNGFVDFLIRRDHRRRLRYASLQSPRGRELTARFDPGSMESVVLLDRGEIYVESRAALRILTKLGGFYRVFGLLVVIPRPLSDAIYRFVARRRYRMFGKRSACRVPDPEEAHLFLEN